MGRLHRLSTAAGRTSATRPRERRAEDDPRTTDKDEAQEELADSPTLHRAGGAGLIAWTDWRKRDSAGTKPHQQYDIFIASPGGENRQVDPYGERQVSTFSPSICATGKRDALVAFQDSSRGRGVVRAVRMRRCSKRAARS